MSQNSQDNNTCANDLILMKLQSTEFNFIKKEIPAQMFSCEFCKIFLNDFFNPNLGGLFIGSF